MSNSELLNGIKTFHAKTRRQWRTWLEKNHASEKCVWLILYGKNRQTPGISYVEAVEEALCFGWIDSKAVKRDEESHYQYYCPRKPRSGWSKLNRERADRLMREGLMTPAGQAMIDLAKKNGTWEAFLDIENEVIPDDLKKRFSKNKKAYANFQSFSPSSRKIILTWIQSAKKPETRLQRLHATVEHAARNEKAYP